MVLDLLPSRHGSAAENMAIDFLLLQRYPENNHARFRHYGWHRAALTFGYSQKISFVRAQLNTDDPIEVCRRPTGGGIVDHRADWTYALVIPRSHPSYEARATESYRLIHAAIAETFAQLGQSAALKPAAEALDEAGAAPGGLAGVCFQRAEIFDVIDPTTRAKIAGAAQKRNKHGLLFQGSLSRDAVLADLDWSAFHELVVQKLASALGIPAEDRPWPEFAEGELSGLTEHYRSPEWNEFR